MHRRDFFDPRKLATATGQLLGAADEVQRALAPPTQVTEPEVALLRLSQRAMATTFEILAPFSADNRQITQSATVAFELLAELEEQMTVYRDSSEVSQLNQLAFSQEVVVESRLFALLRLAKELHEETAGVYDLAIGALLRSWGFFRGPKRVPSTEEITENLARSGMHQVIFNETQRSIRFATAGVELNLGSIGKGAALDRLGEVLPPPYLLHGGSSGVLAAGDSHEQEHGWRVRVQHPANDGRTLAEIFLKNRALGTSAATFQYLRYQGRKLGHILDPRTGWPAAGVASVSVAAPSAALADALSTAFYVGGETLAQSYCQNHPEIAVLMLKERSKKPLVIGFADHEIRLN
jgi:thiamine biosynthesis lipoprotein